MPLVFGYKILKMVLLSILIVGVSLSSALIFIPQVIFNNFTASVVFKILKLENIQVDTNNIQFSISNQDLTKKHLSLDLKHLCFQTGEKNISDCVTHLALAIDFDLARPLIRIYNIDHAVVEGESLQVKLVAATSSAGAGHFSIRDIFPQDLTQLKVGAVAIHLKHLQINSGSFALAGEVNLDSDSRILDGNRVGRLVGALHDSTSNVDLQTTLNLQSPSWTGDQPMQIRGSADITTSELAPARLDVQAEIFQPKGAFHVRVKAPKACMVGSQLPLEGCIDALDIGLVGALSESGFRISSLDPVKLYAPNLTVKEVASASSESSAFLYRSLHQSLDQLFQFQLDNVDVRLDRLVFNARDKKVSSSVSARAFNKNGILNFSSTLNLPISQSLAKLSFQVGAAGKVIRLKGLANFISPDLNSNIPIQVDFYDHKASLNFHPTLSSVSKKLSVETEIRGQWEGQKLDFIFSTLKIQDSNRIAIQRLKPGPCSLSLAGSEKVDLDCRLNLAVRQDQPLPEVSVAVRAAFERKDKFWNGFLSLRSEPIKSEVLAGSIAVRADADSLDLDQIGPTSFKLTTDIDLHIPRLQRWITAIHNSTFAVPAPLNALDGDVHLSSKGTIQNTSQEIPIILETRLAGDQQVFFVDSKIFVKLISKAGGLQPLIRGDIQLSDIMLALPRLKIGKLPEIVPDRRIAPAAKVEQISADSKPAASPAVPFAIHVFTPPDHPVRLISNLARAPIPIALDLKLTSQEGPRGLITIETFPVELFRRNAELKFLKLNLKSDRTDENPISGHMVVKILDYTISVDVTGTIKEPVVKLDSVPQLKDNEIVSVLLFGKPSDQLDSQQNQSAASVQSALADRALGLFSLYYLASTPIESVGYNSQQKIFTAKVRLQEGLSLDLGADQSDLKQIGLNKQLGGSWVIRTYVTNPSDSNSQSLTAFLEKVFRY